MVRVIWARLFGWTDMGESLYLILDLSVAVHGSVGTCVLRGLVALMGRSGCVY